MTTLTSRIERWGSLESLAARSFLNSELESKALAEVTKKLRDAMMPKMTMTALESLQSTTRFLLASGLTGGKILHLSELLREMGGDVSEERKREMKTPFDGRAA